MATVIAYVDGFNLYHGLHQAYGRRYLWLDLQHLVQRARPHDQILAVRHFTAEVRDDPDGLARQRIYLAALKAYSPAVEVVLGRYQTKTMTCRRCGSTWTSYEEKETDVNIAVSLVGDTAGSASELALIISADSDLCPAIRTARSLNPRRGMIAAFPPRYVLARSTRPNMLIAGQKRHMGSLSCGDQGVSECLLIQGLRGQVEAIRPYDRSSLGVYPDLSEVDRVIERFQHSRPPFSGEVDVAYRAVTEQQAKHAVSDHGNAHNAGQIDLAHAVHATAVARC